MAIHSMRAPRQIVSRWLNTITAYNFKVFHLKGKLNTCADFLSRLKNTTNEKVDDGDEGPFVICAVEEETEIQPGSAVVHNTQPGATGRAQVPSQPDIRGLNLKNGQQEDDDITTIRKWIEEEKIPVEDDLREKSTRLKRLAAILYKLEVQEDTLVVKKTGD